MKKRNALIIGFGSIGQKHYSILKKLNFFDKIIVYTKQSKFKNRNNFISNLNNNITNINPYYVIVSSRTSSHFSHLKILEKNLSNSLILIEKPLFEKNKNFKIKYNKVFVGYNLRFHPIINFLKSYLKNKNFFSVNIVCKSYLPNWRKNIQYSISNSAKKSYGGGALLELSHEIDYLQWIFGKIKTVDFSKVKKISKLRVNCEDSAIIIGKTKKIDFMLNLNFYSIKKERYLEIYGAKDYIRADLINFQIEIIKNNKKKIIKFNKKDFSYLKQHKAILNKNYTNICKYVEGQEVLKIIDQVRK